jgi:hypothetical protein
MNKEIKQREKEREKDTDRELSKVDSLIDSYRKNNTYKAFATKNDISTIEIDLNDNEIYKEYSSHNLLNNSIYDYVEDTYVLFNRKNGLEVKFKFPNKMKDDEKERIKELFRVHYALKYKELRKKMDKQLILSILFIFIGVLILTIHSIYVSLNSTSIYGEVFDIMAWVFVWEAVQTLFVDSLDNRRDLRMYTLLYMAQPELYDKK